MDMAGWLTPIRTWWRRRQSLGARGERQAERLLRAGGYRILGRNVKLPVGEIDLLAEDPRGGAIVVVEVKSGTSENPPPEVHVDPRKQHKLTQLGRCLMKRRRFRDRLIRFDVVAVVWPDDRRRPTRVTHHVAAFQATGAS
jgi:putative endonuclease